MPNKYRRVLGSRKYHDYTEETLQVAIKDITKNNLTYRAASEKYNISKSTLERKFNKKHMKKPGGQTVLSEVEENIISEAILVAADWGFPLERSDIKDLVEGYLNRQGVQKFSNCKPGDSWYYGFLSRHQNLTQRLSENIKRSRAAVSINILNSYFDNLADSLKDVPPENILNYDESGFVDDPGRNKVVVRKKSKHAERVLDFSKTNTSVMFCVSGSGETLPPYIVYKADHLWSTWTEGGPPNTRYNRSKSGWFDQAIFEDWFLSLALPYLKKLEGPKVLLGDNLSSHISIKVLRECQENDIRFVLLPPNSTHLTQPLDVSCFRPIKGAWRKLLKAWKTRNRGPLRKDMFPQLLRKTLEKVGATQPETVKSGFKTTGLIPLDRNAVLKKLPRQDQNQDETTNSASLIAETLKDLFEEARFGRKTDENTPAKTLKKKKKLNVPAGTSVSVTDVDTTEDVSKSKKQPAKNTIKRPGILKPKQLQPNKRKKGSEFKKNEKENGSEESDICETLEFEESSNEVTAPNMTSFHDLEVNDFIIVELKSVKGKSKRFIGKIIDTNPPRCSYLKQSLKIKDAFIFPQISDEGDISESEYVIKLAPPKISRRGALTFNETTMRNYYSVND